MAEDKDLMNSAALDWVIRLREPGFDDWERFESWLAADPAHAEAYHRHALADQEMAELLATAPPPQAKPRATRRAWLGGALAAALVGVVGVSQIGRTDPYAVETAAGVRRTVSLPDGTRISLNGGTRLMLDHRNPRYAEVTRGEALFDVVHDANAPFKVAVGPSRLVDIGTRFNVVREGRTTAVQVAEGAVMYDPEGAAVRLDAGRTLRAIDGDPLVVLGRQSPAAIASWKEGRLIYDGQTMAEVAADLSRWTGQTVTVDPRVAERRFRGVLSLGDGEAVVGLGPLLDVEVRRSGDRWILAPTG